MYMFLYFQCEIKLGNAMKLASIPYSRSKLLSLSLIALLLIPSFMVVPVMAARPPTISGHEDYMEDYGLLHNDTYILYPWEKKSLDIGFSKYGEKISNVSQGLEYDGVDAFANTNVEEKKWSCGWLMDIHFTEQGILKNVWAYALYTDWSDDTGIGGDWRQGQNSTDASASGDTHGGRRTSGYAVTDDIRLIYDGPRKSIYVLNTTIYDKDPANEGEPMVRLIIQLIFNKVKKYVMQIKDIKRIDNNKWTGPFQIEFSERAEWDLKNEINPQSYAEFYDNLTTKYIKHPFYPVDQNVTYDLCQMISDDNVTVGFAAFWPRLISKWVEETETLTRDEVLTSLETHMLDDILVNQSATDSRVTVTSGVKMEITLPFDAIHYPRGGGVWDDEPWVFKNVAGEWQELNPGEWIWTSPDNVTVLSPYFGTNDKFAILYKRERKGALPNTEMDRLSCMPNDLFKDWPGTTYGMYNEPRVPYVFAEWDFDLDYNLIERSSHQFRCVSVYGLTDFSNAVDPDMGANSFRIEREVQYQLNEVFNPWDLKDASHKDTFRWAQKQNITTTITLAAHVHDKYNNSRLCLENHTLWVPEKWGYYCNDSEKVILYDTAGAVGPTLLYRNHTPLYNQYTISGWTITLNTSAITSYSSYDWVKVLYSTKNNATANARAIALNNTYHTGRWEWEIVGNISLASDSIGSGMISAAWQDWKNKEMWLSGVDIQAEVYGPTIPYVMRPFDYVCTTKADYYYNDTLGDHRSAFKDDWSTPEDWDGTVIYPYAISSSNVIVVGGPIVSLTAEYFNDFTDALVFTEYELGYYSPACWARTSQPTLASLTHQGTAMNLWPQDELWYNSTTVSDDLGYAIVSTYKDLNETVGFIVYGYTAEDTYYASYALRGGLIPWLQELQTGVTTLVIEFNYTTLHPVAIHVKEALGTFTECTGFDTSFKTSTYTANLAAALAAVNQTSYDLGICYKLVDFTWCAQVHPDP